MTQSSQWRRRFTNTARLVGLVLAVPFLVVFFTLALVAFLVWRLSLLAIIWTLWCSRGRDILFVYSNSPLWQSHLEEAILPHIRGRAVILNWSERKQWKASVAVLAFLHFGGSREFNPLAVVFRPFRSSRTFRFWSPFQDFKRGNPGSLMAMQQAFFETIGVRPIVPDATKNTFARNS